MCIVNIYKYIISFIYVKVKVIQLCLTLCNPMDCTVHGVFQARILERVAILFSRGSSQPRNHTRVSCIAGGFFTSWATREALYIHFIFLYTCMCYAESLSCVLLFVTPWTVAPQAPLPMGFSRQEYWSGLPCPLPGDPPNPGIKPRSVALQVDSLPAELEAHIYIYIYIYIYTYI